MSNSMNLVERFWLPLSLAVIAGWGSVTFLLVNTFGWFVLLAIVGVVAAGTATAVVLVKASSEDDSEYVLPAIPESDDVSWRNAA